VTNIFKVAADNVPTRDITFDGERLKLPSMAFKHGISVNFILTRHLIKRR
jgi:hypothetical protein